MPTLLKLLKNTDILFGVGMLVIVAMLILPLPIWLLDASLVMAIATSVIIMLTSVNVKEPLHFSVFPSLLVVTTLFRVALSIAATKLILGTGDGGSVINTFGNFVLGGNFVVGFVSFLILMIVQFIVITNGATRVSEVVARFTLDAMPGKQMAIDADLASGLIDEAGAKERRKKVKAEADFYGAMDGASKFVKGDAIASLLIIIVNIIGGFIMGFMRGEGGPMDILQSYALLSVGEGLVSQIPALLISTASGLLVTRNGQESGMAGTMFSQILRQPRVLATAGGSLCLFAFIPGFPTMIFLLVGGTLFGISRLANSNPNMADSVEGLEEEKAPEQEALPTPKITGPEAVLPLIAVDPIEIEIGYGLTKLADVRVGGDLSERVGSTREQIALDLGYVMPSVRIRDNAILKSNEYVLKIRGEAVASAEVMPDNLLAIDSGVVLNKMDGGTIKEPVFGLDAVWIEPRQREQAERNGYTVVEPTAMLTTHLAEIVKRHASELLSREETAHLINTIKGTNDTLLKDLEPAGVGTGDVQKVLQHLLSEQITIRDMVTILETMVDYAGRVNEMEQMGELVRASIARTISRQFADDDNTIHCVTLEPPLESTLQEAIQNTAGGVLMAIEPSLGQMLAESLKEKHDVAIAEGNTPVILCSTQVRLPLRKHIERQGLTIPVLAYNEISASVEVEFVGQVGLGEPGTMATAS